MNRIKITLPTSFIFSTEVRVRVGDVNYAGHLGNDRVLSLLHEARVRFLNAHGYAELDVEGQGTIMVDAAVIYKAEAFAGERLKIELAVDDFHRYGCVVYYRVTRAEDKKEICRARTGLAFFDYGERKLAPVPEKFRELCVGLAQAH
ncbi:MAG: thioesterase [Calditrichaeota bacterium]|nr:MAG: thioesterase [Calditrichota bacterium]